MTRGDAGQEFDRNSCVLETVMAANGYPENLETEPYKALGSMVAEAAVEADGRLSIDCGRCGTRFSVGPLVEDRVPVVLDSERRCDRGVKVTGDQPGDWQLNINVRKLRDRNIITPSDDPDDL